MMSTNATRLSRLYTQLFSTPTPSHQLFFSSASSNNNNNNNNLNNNNQFSAEKLFSVRGKVCVITGGSRGIGEMLASGFACNGAKVYISSRKKAVCDDIAKKLTELAVPFGGSCISIPADLSSEEECVRFVNELKSREKHINVLINNAGITWGGSLEEFPLSGAAWDKLLALNVRSVFSLTQKLLPLLKAATLPENLTQILRAQLNSEGNSSTFDKEVIERAQKYGGFSSVLTIGSVDGIKVPRYGDANKNFSYAASKAALHHLTRILATELAPFRINVNCIAPGPFPSQMTNFILKQESGEDLLSSNVPLGRIGTAEDIVGASLFLSSRAGSYVTGAILPLEGGLLL